MLARAEPKPPVQAAVPAHAAVPVGAGGVDPAQALLRKFLGDLAKEAAAASAQIGAAPPHAADAGALGAARNAERKWGKPTQARWPQCRSRSPMYVHLKPAAKENQADGQSSAMLHAHTHTHTHTHTPARSHTHTITRLPAATHTHTHTDAQQRTRTGRAKATFEEVVEQEFQHGGTAAGEVYDVDDEDQA
jgi:hypothetical protein